MSDVTNTVDPLGARGQLTTSQGTNVTYYRLQKLQEEGLVESLERLPFTVRILLENLLRHSGGEFVEEAQLAALAGWTPEGEGSGEHSGAQGDRRERYRGGSDGSNAMVHDFLPARAGTPRRHTAACPREGASVGG